MADYTAVRVDDIEATAPATCRRAGEALGVEAFAIGLHDLPPLTDDHPQHDHAGDGREEVYVTLEGWGELDVDGERVRLGPEVLVRVGPDARRKVYPGPDGIRVLVVGATAA